jgi:hypothetical protein
MVTTALGPLSRAVWRVTSSRVARQDRPPGCHSADLPDQDRAKQPDEATDAPGRRGDHRFVDQRAFRCCPDGRSANRADVAQPGNQRGLSLERHGRVAWVDQ